jgi:hypothetical protein
MAVSGEKKARRDNADTRKAIFCMDIEFIIMVCDGFDTEAPFVIAILVPESKSNRRKSRWHSCHMA